MKILMKKNKNRNAPSEKIIQLCSLVLKGLLTGLLVDLDGNLQPRPNTYVSSILLARSPTRPEYFLVIGNVV